MLRTSDYNIYIPIDDVKQEYLLLHGYSGAVDVVTEDIVKKMSDLSNCSNKNEIFDKDTLEKLKTRGYITEKSKEEEKSMFSKIAQAMHNISKKSLGITIIPSYQCNFRCKYCFESGNYSKGNELLNKKMDYNLVDQIFEAIEKGKKDGRKVTKRITLFGGEPLTKENYNIVKYIVDKSVNNGFEVGAITNGYDLDYFEKLIAKDKISVLQITIDGMADFHDHRRFKVGFKPTFDKIVNNIDNVLKTGIKVSVRSNIDEENFVQINKLIEFYNEKKWNEKPNFSYNFKSVYSKCSNDDKQVSDIDICKELLKYMNEGENYKCTGGYSNLYIILMELLKNKKMLLLKSEFCSSVSGAMVVVDPFGDLYPCWEVVGEKKYAIGKLRNGIFDYNDNYNYWSNRSVDKIDECSECAYGMFCGGGCPAHAKNKNDNMYSANCDIFKNIFNESLLAAYSKIKN